MKVKEYDVFFEGSYKNMTFMISKNRNVENDWAVYRSSDSPKFFFTGKNVAKLIQKTFDAIDFYLKEKSENRILH